MTNHTTTSARQLALVELNADGDPVGPTVRWPQDWPSAAQRIDLSAATLDQAVAAWREWVSRADEGLLVDVAGGGEDDRVRVVLVSGRAWLATLQDTPGGPNGTPAPEAGERAPKPGEVCSCGRAAVTVYVTSEFGDVPYCGIPNTGPFDRDRKVRAASTRFGLPQDIVDLLDLNEVTPEAYIAHHFPGSTTWLGDRCGCIDDRCIGHHHDPADDCHCAQVILEDFMANVPVRDWSTCHCLTVRQWQAGTGQPSVKNRRNRRGAEGAL